MIFSVPLRVIEQVESQYVGNLPEELAAGNTVALSVKSRPEHADPGSLVGY